MITHNLKNVGYLINIFISLLFTEMVVPVMLDILQILTGFRCEFNGFHRKPSRQLSLFSETHFFSHDTGSPLLKPSASKSRRTPGYVTLPVSLEGDEVTRGLPHSVYDNHLIL